MFPNWKKKPKQNRKLTNSSVNFLNYAVHSAWFSLRQPANAFACEKTVSCLSMQPLCPVLWLLCNHRPWGHHSRACALTWPLCLLSKQVWFWLYSTGIALSHGSVSRWCPTCFYDCPDFNGAFMMSSLSMSQHHDTTAQTFMSEKFVFELLATASCSEWCWSSSFHGVTGPEWLQGNIRKRPKRPGGVFNSSQLHMRVGPLVLKEILQRHNWLFTPELLQMKLWLSHATRLMWRSILEGRKGTTICIP